MSRRKKLFVVLTVVLYQQVDKNNFLLLSNASRVEKEK